MLSHPYLVTAVVTAAVVVVCVVLHYEGLRILTDRLPRPKHHHRRRIVMLILALMLIHIVEVWIFGIAYFGLLQFDGFGALQGAVPTAFVDYVYYSATVYTTVGFGDMYPVGPIRTMSGTEGITGLTLITWSASYTLLEMLKSWRPDD